MAIVVVRGSCLLINSCVSFLSVLHNLLLDLQQRYAVILLDQHLKFQEDALPNNRLWFTLPSLLKTTKESLIESVYHPSSIHPVKYIKGKKSLKSC